MVANTIEQWFAVLVVHALGLTIFSLVLQWCKDAFPSGIGTGEWDTSFSWEEGDAKVFNYHPLFMTTGFIFIYSEAAIAYKWLPVPRRVAKAIHVGLQTVAAVFMIVGLTAVFRFHNESDPPIANMYSMHSWLGITCVVLFSLQYLAGIYHFLTPEEKLPNTDAAGKAQYLAYHKLIGVVLLALCVATACLGLLEKMAFMNAFKPDEEHYGDEPLHLAPAYYRANTIAVLMVLLVAMVALVISRPSGDEREFRGARLLD